MPIIKSKTVRFLFLWLQGTYGFQFLLKGVGNGESITLRLTLQCIMAWYRTRNLIAWSPLPPTTEPSWIEPLMDFKSHNTPMRQGGILLSSLVSKEYGLHHNSDKVTTLKSYHMGTPFKYTDRISHDKDSHTASPSL